MNKIHTNSVQMHRDMPTEIYDKSTWNTFFDNIEHGIFENVLFIMTTNQPPDYFDNLDPSYMRKGRVQEKFVL